MMNYLMNMDERARVDKLEAQFQTAEKIKKTECQKCGFCCHRRTCVPTPEEIPKIAEFLKLSIPELIKTYYCIDAKTESMIYHIKPAGINQKDLLGQFIPGDRTFNEGPCIFLTEEKLCQIHPVRPKSAKLQECWTPNSTYNEFAFWKEDSLKKLYPEWERED